MAKWQDYDKIWYFAYGLDIAQDIIEKLIEDDAPHWNSFAVVGNLYYTETLNNKTDFFYKKLGIEQVLGRLWLLDLDQLEKVFRKKNASTKMSFESIVDLSRDHRTKHTAVVAPIVTITGDSRDFRSRFPSEAAVNIIAKGLNETHDLDRDATLKYLKRFAKNSKSIEKFLEPQLVSKNS